MTKTSPAKASPADRRVFFVSLGIFIVTCIVVAISVISRSGGVPSSGGNTNPPLAATPAQVMTLPAEVITNLTQMPLAEPLSGTLANELRALEQSVNACAAYSPERRGQMHQHIAWLLEPAKLPREMIIALGENPEGKLVMGMATYTMSEWGLQGKPPDSCLLPIGQELNRMLVAMGEAPVDDFE